MLAIVVAGGDFLPSVRAMTAARAADMVIAADSGARHLAALGRRADLLIGDFDSYRVPADSSVESIAYPSSKDVTDTHLAVREAISRGADRVILLAAMRGPRLDHGVANTALLAADEFVGRDVRAFDGEDELRVVRNASALSGRPGDLVTLLAVTDVAMGVTTQGLAYPLEDAVLRRGETRGVSNILEHGLGGVRLRSGVLLMIHRNGGDPNALG